MKAVILAAGYATRLYPLTLHTPKCLLTVAGRTLLDTLCEKVNASKEIDEIIVITNAKFYPQLCVWQEKARPGPQALARGTSAGAVECPVLSSGVPVRILNDRTLSNETRLGAIGDLGFAIRKCHLDTDILMLAGDNLFDSTFADFLSFSKNHKEAVSIALYDIQDARRASKKFGVVEIDASSEVIGLEEKPEHPRSSYIGMGVYYFPKSSLRLVNEYLSGDAAKDAPGYYIQWLLGKVRVFGFLFQGMWYDIGNLSALEEANKAFARKISN